MWSHINLDCKEPWQSELVTLVLGTSMGAWKSEHQEAQFLLLALAEKYGKKLGKLLYLSISE